jgi:hypothetical protein
MKNLIEISRIVTKKKVRKIEIFDGSTLENKSSKFGEFYEALVAGKFKNDRDAATFLYGCSPTDDKYRQLKSRFRKRLLNTLFFIDMNEPGASGYDRAYFTSNKDWTLVKILISNDAHNSAEELARQILNIAQRFRFADVIVNCCRILRRYAAEAGNSTEFEEYDRLIKQYSNVMEAEIRSEELFQRTKMNYISPASEIKELTEQLSVYGDALVGLSEMYDSPIILYNMYLVWVYRYEMLQDYQAMLEVCSQAESYIEENPNYLQEDKVITFHLKKMSAYLHIRDFKNGKISAEKSLKIFPEGSDVWTLFMEYYLLLAFHTDNHINALAIFNQARSLANFKKMDNETREKWKVYEVYLAYFLENQAMDNPELKAQSKKTFRVSRFLNEPILHPRELRVFTVHLLVAQVLFLLDMKDYHDAAERIDRLRSYATKQLDRSENFRMIQFVRLLQQLSKADFQLTELSNTNKYYDRLIEHPFFYRGIINELEVVPYEKLWNYILAKVQ